VRREDLWGRLATCGRLGVPSGPGLLYHAQCRGNACTICGLLLCGQVADLRGGRNYQPSRAVTEKPMTNRIACHCNGRHRPLMSVAALVAIVIPLVSASHLCAQSQDIAPSFEAASIKPTQVTGQGASIDRHPGMLLMKNVTLQDCIREAYGVTDSQIAGQDRLSPGRYDIVAKIPPQVTRNQYPAMLQTLLAERFKLAVHHGTKEMPVYLLVVAKNGPKIQAVEPGNGGIASPHAGYMSAVAITMPRLATFLSGPRAQLEHATIDRTGLSGSFTFKLEWTPDDKQSADTFGPSLFTALQEQLGLKLETGKAPMEILIIDHAEKPSEN
jgi:uncharacterized protein (TIGR03435 family)